MIPQWTCWLFIRRLAELAMGLPLALAVLLARFGIQRMGIVTSFCILLTMEGIL